MSKKIKWVFPDERIWYDEEIKRMWAFDGTEIFLVEKADDFKSTMMLWQFGTTDPIYPRDIKAVKVIKDPRWPIIKK